jgi:hypothetical protein
LLLASPPLSASAAGAADACRRLLPRFRCQRDAAAASAMLFAAARSAAAAAADAPLAATPRLADAAAIFIIDAAIDPACRRHLMPRAATPLRHCHAERERCSERGAVCKTREVSVEVRSAGEYEKELLSDVTCHHSLPLPPESRHHPDAIFRRHHAIIFAAIADITLLFAATMPPPLMIPCRDIALRHADATPLCLRHCADYYVILRHACHYADTYAICHAAHAYFADAAAFISSD